MGLVTVPDIAKKWGIPERTVRDWCLKKKIPATHPDEFSDVIDEKTNKVRRKNVGQWLIDESISCPVPTKREISFNELLKYECHNKILNSIYFDIQVLMTYHSNHMEGNSLSFDQVESLFETKAIKSEYNNFIPVDDIFQTINHFECIDYVIKNYEEELSEKFIKDLHRILFNKIHVLGSKKGEYKKFPNKISGIETTNPKNVSTALQKLFESYSSKTIFYRELAKFHINFLKISPFQTANKRIARLILLKECLKNNLVPIMINSNCNSYYNDVIKKEIKDPDKDDLFIFFASENIKKLLDYYKLPYSLDSTKIT